MVQENDKWMGGMVFQFRHSPEAQTKLKLPFTTALSLAERKPEALLPHFEIKAVPNKSLENLLKIFSRSHLG